MNAKQMMRTVVYIGYIIVYNLIFFLKGTHSRMDRVWICVAGNPGFLHSTTLL